MLDETSRPHPFPDCQNRECIHAVVGYIDGNFQILGDKIDARLEVIERLSNQNAIDAAAFRASVEAWRSEYEKNTSKINSLLDEYGERLASLEKSRDRAATIYRFVAWIFGAAIAIVGAWQSVLALLRAGGER